MNAGDRLTQLEAGTTVSILYVQEVLIKIYIILYIKWVKTYCTYSIQDPDPFSLTRSKFKYNFPPKTLIDINCADVVHHLTIVAI